MTGVQEYNKGFLDKINNAIKTHPSYIGGYVRYMNNVSISTKYAYMNYVINFVKFINKPIKELIFDDFSAYLSSLEYKENGETTTSSYRISVYAALKRFSKYLYTTKIIPEDYMEYIERPKAIESQKTIEKRSIGFLTKEEISKYIKNVEDNNIHEHRQIGYKWNLRDNIIIKIFLNTGIRCSALMKLDISSINLKNKTLIVTDKGSKVKIYNLSDDLIVDIREWLEIREDEIQDNDDALFISNRKKRMCQESISTIVKKYSNVIDNKNITPHKLRATYGTQLYNATRDIYFVQDCMGHSNPKTTELYVRDKKQNMKKASDIMSQIVQ